MRRLLPIIVSRRGKSQGRPSTAPCCQSRHHFNALRKIDRISSYEFGVEAKSSWSRTRRAAISFGDANFLRALKRAHNLLISCRLVPGGNAISLA